MTVITNFIQESLPIAADAILQIVFVIIGIILVNIMTKISKNVGIEKDSKTMEQIEATINTIVIATNQKIVNKIKEESPDGNLSDEQKETIFNSVKEAVVKCLTVSQVNYILSRFANIDDGLEYLIEKSVSYNKYTPLNEICINSSYINDSDEGVDIEK